MTNYDIPLHIATLLLVTLKGSELGLEEVESTLLVVC
jgi:hypothetical protein